MARAPRRRRELAGLTPLQIDEDAQVDHDNASASASEDDMSDIRSPDTDDIVSPASQESQAKVWRESLQRRADTHFLAQQPQKLDTTLPVHERSNSDDAPPSVIHAPPDFKAFVRAGTTSGYTA